ncbi:MAG: HaeIII family restriction endonuclease [Clostridiales bacterium]|jgi:hypothetical protein|nr:HaeIII family restriction endonuclease [Clostridiales bacterium]
MPGQTQKGKAFEYACLISLYNSFPNTNIQKNPSVEKAFSFYEGSATELRNKMDKAAAAAIRIIKGLEPMFNEGVQLSLQEDSKGIAGDVRDVLISSGSWGVGVSCKHNHTAVKHSRLSKDIDFGLRWFDKPCSDNYFSQVKPLFNELEQMKGKKWSEIKDKEGAVYKPLLDAFQTELKWLGFKYKQEIPPLLLSYLLGKYDFYKVITKDSKKLTQVQAYNIFGTLNKPSKKQKPLIKVAQLKLPTKIYDISYKKINNNTSKNTVALTFDNGWALTFRIHNADTYVEPSLKFDVQLIGVPESLHTQIEPW